MTASCYSLSQIYEAYCNNSFNVVLSFSLQLQSLLVNRAKKRKQKIYTGLAIIHWIMAGGFAKDG